MYLPSMAQHFCRALQGQIQFIHHHSVFFLPSTARHFREVQGRLDTIHNHHSSSFNSWSSSFRAVKLKLGKSMIKRPSKANYHQQVKMKLLLIFTDNLYSGLTLNYDVLQPVVGSRRSPSYRCRLSHQSREGWSERSISRSGARTITVAMSCLSYIFASMNSRVWH